MSFRANLTGNMAYQSQMRGDSEKAKALYQEAIANGMNKPNLIDAYGVLLMREGKFEEAIETFGKALRLNPDLNTRYSIRLHRAVSNMKIGKLKSAKVALEDIFEKQQTQQVYETLGYFYVITDDEKAREFNEEAINVYDDNVTILDNIGQYYLDKGHPKIALEFLEDACEINDTKVDVNFHLAKSYELLGDKKKALDYINKAKECPITALNDTKPEDIEALLNKLLG